MASFRVPINDVSVREFQTLPLVIVVGPTGAGKSDLALRLAETAGGEVVSADSQQVYRFMNIGTGKVSERDAARVPHHMIDIVDPDDEMTAPRFAALADRTIEDASSRRVPIVVAGGTGLYVRSLLLGLFPGPASNHEVRARLGHRADQIGVSALWDELRAIDPVMARQIAATDRRRLIRALEVFELTGVPMSEHQRQHDHHKVPARYVHRLVCLAPPRDVLYARINQRVDEMFERGLVAEVERLRARGYGPQLRSQQAIGYQEVHSMFGGELSLDQARHLVKRNSRRYARRQLSWYRNGPESNWVEWYGDQSEVDLLELRRYLREPIVSHG